MLLPAGVIQSIDLDNRVVRVACTKDQIKNAPDYEELRANDVAYRDEVSGYYTGMEYTGM
jgi:stress response protein YsnF